MFTELSYPKEIDAPEGLLNKYAEMPLRMEIVPEPAWYFNLRKMFTATMWGLVRNRVYGEFWYTCPFCHKEFWDLEKQEWQIKSPVGGGLHAHEIWTYDDDKHIQTCEGIVALCPACHGIKHMVLTQKRAQEKELKMADVISHFCTVNNCMPSDFDEILKFEMNVFYFRNNFEWTCEIGDYMEYVGPKAAPFIALEMLTGNIDLVSDKVLTAVEKCLIEIDNGTFKMPEK